MHNKLKFNSVAERLLSDPEYKRLYDEAHAVFRLETQIALAMEDKGWSCTDLARATNTSKSNVSRDLRAGGLINASLSRIGRIADVLGMKLVTLLIPKNAVGRILPRIEQLIFDASNTAVEVAVEAPALSMILGSTFPSEFEKNVGFQSGKTGDLNFVNLAI